MFWTVTEQQKQNSDLLNSFLDCECCYFSYQEVTMKNRTWLRKNWLLVAGLSFLGIHFGTYFIQRMAKSSAKSSLELKDSKNNQ
ncbi:uncharacterized LOC128706666 homolog [Pelobates fuscus]|uniref:uncharacterized LOC128706666 homolog n=1 Tax=Pelobates fuscus TaxID=191477 RepID=UPI002FE4EF8B